MNGVVTPIGVDSGGAWKPLLLGPNGETIVNGIPAAAALAEGMPNPTTPTFGNARLQFNGSTWERTRGNVALTLLASAVRNATNFTAVANFSGRGGTFYLNVTAVPGVQTLTLSIFDLDPISGNVGAAILASTASAAIGFTMLTVYPGVTAAANRAASYPLPRSFVVQVVHSGGGNFTYSLGAHLIL